MTKHFWGYPDTLPKSLQIAVANLIKPEIKTEDYIYHPAKRNELVFSAASAVVYVPLQGAEEKTPDEHG